MYIYFVNISLEYEGLLQLWDTNKLQNFVKGLRAQIWGSDNHLDLYWSVQALPVNFKEALKIKE